jgi:hypothetical protein
MWKDSGPQCFSLHHEWGRVLSVSQSYGWYPGFGKNLSSCTNWQRTVIICNLHLIHSESVRNSLKVSQQERKLVSVFSGGLTLLTSSSKLEGGPRPDTLVRLPAPLVKLVWFPEPKELSGLGARPTAMYGKMPFTHVVSLWCLLRSQMLQSHHHLCLMQLCHRWATPGSGTVLSIMDAGKMASRTDHLASYV